jgi:arginase
MERMQRTQGLSLQAALTVFRGRAGDRNARAMAGVSVLGEALARQTGLLPSVVGHPEPPLGARWDAELDAARTALAELAEAYETLLQNGRKPLTVMGRCAAALATLPAVAKARPDACVVWFDAHADSNTPQTTSTGYLGGIVITGAAGLWESGLGKGLNLANVVLVGARDIDPAEQALIDAGTLRLVPPGPDLAERLRAAVAGREVYVHLDCDVLEPGIVPTEYRVTGGLTLADLGAAAKVLAEHRVIGLEIAEFESVWPETGAPGIPDGLCDALSPLLDALR